MKLGETIFGVTVWAVLPGRQPGQQTDLAHLTWGGPGEAVHLRGDGITDGHMEHYGRDLGPVANLAVEHHHRIVIAFVGMGFEAKIAAGPGVLVVCRDSRRD